ncbi:MAG: hypothetical protein QN152_08350 [Armatimonadota bacterium]|nr:hypothetical protein [Armatimonadota bacterium]MDR7464315.1 hypothetical protein [Armatimonadota bacterium]MDR7468925.1 hypothetical protein [Armatimonadota bacterium]MDR7475035.1 hypothetical protein [Armatimonadota bacterium]MDR7539522.1 hypothetical protein [Armatimonadota bacterium]
MTPPVAIALAYGITAAALLLYLQRLRRRLRRLEADLQVQRRSPRPGGTVPSP